VTSLRHYVNKGLVRVARLEDLLQAGINLFQACIQGGMDTRIIGTSCGTKVRSTGWPLNGMATNVLQTLANLRQLAVAR
jgi:hypothetical protein